MEIKMERVNTERATTDKLVHDLRLVVEDAEDLIKATASQGGEKVSAARAKAAVQATDQYAHENAWTAIGTGASLGFLVGYLMGRR